MTKSTQTFQNWRKSTSKLPGIDTLHMRKPPMQKNPSLTAGKNMQQAKPITLVKLSFLNGKGKDDD